MRKEQTVSLMVVDDYMEHRLALAKILSKEGYKVTQASSGEEAMAFLSLSEEPFDLIIADLRMPEKNGLQLLEEIKHLCPQTMVIILTAYGEPESFKEAMERGAFAYLHKPIRREEILEAVEKALNEGSEGWLRHGRPQIQAPPG